MFKRTILPSKIKLVTEKSQGFRSCALGVFLLRGVRDEPASLQGITHFIEHLLFKGTKKRTALQISKEIEDRGGTIDAYTAKEMMFIYAKVLDSDLPVAIDVIGDIVTQSLFDEKEIQKEKEVVLEEYREFLDDPDDTLFSLLYSAIYPDHPMSKEILGTEETIKNFKRKDIIDYWGKMVNPENICIIAAGSVDNEVLREKVEEVFSVYSSSSSPVLRDDSYAPPILKNKILPRINQMQFAVGFRIFPFKDPRRYAIMVANSIVGGNMSSRLFQKIREEYGLAYQINSFLDFHSDTGLFGISFALEPKKFVKAYEILDKELTKLREKGLSKDELESAKSHALGNLAISLENTSTRLLRLANLEIYLQAYYPIEETIQRVENLKLKEVNEVLYKILDPENRGFSAVTPEEMDFGSILGTSPST